MPSPLFADRRDAGRQLADRLARYRGRDVVVLGLPRGGVPVAAEIARSLDAPLDVLVARKVGAPDQPELGVGAVAPGGVLVLDDGALDALGLTEDDLAATVGRERAEVERRLVRYRGGGMPDVEGKTVILVDDGLATGVTASAAIEAVRRFDPEAVVLAVPVCAQETAARLAQDVEEVVCVSTPEAFRAVGRWYEDFDPTTDEEVVRLLEAARRAEAADAALPHRDGAAEEPVRVEADADEAEVHRAPAEIAALVARHAEPFGSVDDADLDALLDRIGDARAVCVGEASHGTHEFYQLRARITQALIERKGFTVVGAEADWPDAERVDAYVRHREPGEQEWEAFARFPTWMWRNEPVRDFVEWLRERNDGRPEAERAGFFGLDLYSLYASLEAVLGYLDDRDPELAATARSRYSCLLPFSEDPALYGQAVVTRRYQDCEDEAVEMLQDLLRQRLRLTEGPGAPEAAFPFFDAAQNARVVRDAEAYYRQMFYGTVSTWNLRDTHMMGTLQALLTFFGPDAKAVVWAHNSHLGDAAATQMGQRGEINLGHLCRRAYGDDAYLIGFGTHTGTVLAADDWGREGRVKGVRPSHPESYEWLGHESGVARFFLPLRDADGRLREELGHPRLERAIGVIYRPQTELQSHYFPAVLPDQFDEWVWIDETRALTPLGPSHAPDLPHTHPFRLLAD